MVDSRIGRKETYLASWAGACGLGAVALAGGATALWAGERD